jgi:hypothetical protein
LGSNKTSCPVDVVLVEKKAVGLYICLPPGKHRAGGEPHGETHLGEVGIVHGGRVEDKVAGFFHARGGIGPVVVEGVHFLD